MAQFSFPRLDRPESPDRQALLHNTSSHTIPPNDLASSSAHPQPLPSSLASTLSPRSAKLMAAVLAAAGEDEVIKAVARAHSRKAAPPLTHTLRHRLQEPCDAEVEAANDAGMQPARGGAA